MAIACTWPSENLVLVLALVHKYMPYHTLVKILPLVLGFIIPSSFVSQVHIHEFLILGLCPLAKILVLFLV